MVSTASATLPTASMSTTTATSSLTSTATSRTSPILSSGFSGAPAPLWQGSLQPQMPAMLQQPVDAERAMTQLEEEVQFSLDYLKDTVDERVTKIQNVNQEINESNLQLLKMTTLMDMKVEEQILGNYKYTLTYSCATIEKDRRYEVKKNMSAISSIINMLKVAAGDNGQGLQPLLVQPSAQSQLIVQPKAAKVNPIDLPQWDGEIARYKCFKVNFDGLIRCTDIPEHLWGPYLFNALNKKHSSMLAFHRAGKGDMKSCGNIWTADLLTDGQL